MACPVTLASSGVLSPEVLGERAGHRGADKQLFIVSERRGQKKLDFKQ
jgi:hypothetical protein